MSEEEPEDQIKKTKPKSKRRVRRRRKTLTTIRIEQANRLKKRHYSKRYLQKMNYVKLRDNWSCQFRGCEKPTGVKLSVHHIVRHHDNKLLRENTHNLISLCNYCHNKKVTGHEKQYEASFKNIARRNARAYKLNKKTKEQILEEQRKNQELPDDFTQYEYKDEKDLIKKKADEHYLRKTWRLMKFRTQNKNSHSYKNYGARGIKMFDEWIDDFDKFQKYIYDNLGEKPENFSIDRMDNEKGYYPGNIRWASDEEQGQNRRTTVLDEAMVGVILILHYKYKWKQSQIMNKFSFNNPTLVRNVIKNVTWCNQVIKYKSIITDQKTLDSINKYEEGLKGNKDG
jgi:hypothetical protein